MHTTADKIRILNTIGVKGELKIKNEPFSRNNIQCRFSCSGNHSFPCVRADLKTIFDHHAAFYLTPKAERLELWTRLDFENQALIYVSHIIPWDEVTILWASYAGITEPVKQLTA